MAEGLNLCSQVRAELDISEMAAEILVQIDLKVYATGTIPPLHILTHLT